MSFTNINMNIAIICAEKSTVSYLNKLMYNLQLALLFIATFIKA